MVTLGNHSATSKLVHWPLTGGMLHLVQRGGAWAPGPAQFTPRYTKCNSPPSTANVPLTDDLTVLLHNLDSSDAIFRR